MSSTVASDDLASKTNALTIALVGNPNVGKTTVFNRLTKNRAKTSNFAGTTVERRQGVMHVGDNLQVRVVDLPGLFSLDTQSPEELVAKSFLEGDKQAVPDAVLVVVEATNLTRSLFLARQILELGIPTIVMVNMIELARSQGIEIDIAELSSRLGCTVLPVSARTGEGFEAVRTQIEKLQSSPSALNVIEPTSCGSCSGCPYAEGHTWASQVADCCASRKNEGVSGRKTDFVDRYLTHPVAGPLAFGLTMSIVFALVFWLATIPMDWLESTFGLLATVVSAWLPAGDFSNLMTDGVLAGVGGVVVFLPQICILFFALSLLEDSGYLSRAVVVVDRWMRKVGLPGQAFVPLLAAHACAIPAIMSTKVISNRRDRLAAILVIPLMTCSARLPVYTMVAALLFPQNALYAALVFVGAYLLGIVMAFIVAGILRLTILPGEAGLLILDLPPYRMPSFKGAAIHAYRRGMLFLRDAGTVILLISIAIWFLSNFPKLSEEQFVAQTVAEKIETTNMESGELDRLRMRVAQEHSLLGRTGKTVEPIFRPLGFDWQTSVGVMASFAAREVVVSTLSVLYGLGDEEDDVSSLRDRLAAAERPDGTKVFTPATCISLLVFFVLAMQCLPTQAVTKKETGSWGWAIFQLVYMTVLAYGMAFIAYRIVDAFTRVS